MNLQLMRLIGRICGNDSEYQTADQSRILPALRLSAEGTHLDLELSEDWLARHPLTRADLEQEADHARDLGVLLSVRPLASTVA